MEVVGHLWACRGPPDPGLGLHILLEVQCFHAAGVLATCHRRRSTGRCRPAPASTTGRSRLRSPRPCLGGIRAATAAAEAGVRFPPRPRPEVTPGRPSSRSRRCRRRECFRCRKISRPWKAFRLLRTLDSAADTRAAAAGPGIRTSTPGFSFQTASPVTSVPRWPIRRQLRLVYTVARSRASFIS